MINVSTLSKMSTKSMKLLYLLSLGFGSRKHCIYQVNWPCKILNLEKKDLDLVLFAK